jgi:hypothetical protein
VSMSKQDFIALADALRTEMPGDNWNPNKRTQWELDVKAVADVCARSNPRFKRERWMRYVAGECGPNGGDLKPVTRGALKRRAVSLTEERSEVSDGN